MKKQLFALAAILTAFSFTAFTKDPATCKKFSVSTKVKSRATKYDARFENKCSTDKKLRFEYSGGASESNINKTSYESKSFEAGWKMYVDGKFLKEMSAGDAGTTITICQ